MVQLPDEVRRAAAWGTLRARRRAGGGRDVPALHGDLTLTLLTLAQAVGEMYQRFMVIYVEEADEETISGLGLSPED
eukprot:1932839-Prymnesium_polylepis.1